MERETFEQIKQLRELGAVEILLVDNEISKVVFERVQKNAKLAEIEKLANLTDNDLLYASSGG